MCMVMSDPAQQLLKICSLNCEQFVEVMRENGFAPEVCQTFKGIAMYCVCIAMPSYSYKVS